MDQNLRTLNSVNMSLAVRTHHNFVANIESGRGDINFRPQLPTCDKQSANIFRVEYPSFKKPRTSQTTMNSSIPFKPEPCFQFLRGHCSYGDNCHFSHGVGDAQKLLPHRQRMMARSWNEDRRTGTTIKLCRRFCNGEECPYGDGCHFLHEGPQNPWKSSAIRIGTTGPGGLSRNGCEQLECKASASVQLSLSANLVSQKPMFWKTRLCKRWDATGNCPYGVNCYFAHGHAELQKSGSLTAMENGNISTSKMISAAATRPNTGNRTAYEQQTQGKKCLFKWKGFKKMRHIYADWIDEIPFVHGSLSKVGTRV